MGPDYDRWSYVGKDNMQVSVEIPSLEEAQLKFHWQLRLMLTQYKIGSAW